MSSENYSQKTEQQVISQNQSYSSPFDDPNSKYFSASPRLKKVFAKITNGAQPNISNIKFSDLEYQQKITGNNFCSHYFTASVQQYYVCEQCSFSLGGFSTMCYCVGCFQEQKHVGHNYYSQIPYSDRAYCDCGRIQRFKVQSFCSKHAGYNVEREYDIKQQEYAQFKATFGQIMELAFEKEQDNGIWRNMSGNLVNYWSKLNENSIYYNRLTIRLLSQTSISKKEAYQNKTYFEILISSYGDLEKFLVHIGGDIRSRKDLIKLVAKINTKENIQNYISSSSLREMINITAVESLLSEGYYDDILYQIIKSENSSRQFPNILSQMLAVKTKNADCLQKITNLQIQSITIDFAWDILSKVFQLYPSSLQIKKFINGDTDPTNPWANFQQVSSVDQTHNNLPPAVQKANKLIVKLLSSIFIGSNQKNLVQTFADKNISQAKLDEILYWVSVSAREVFCDIYNEAPNPAYLISYFLIIKESKERVSLLNKFWTSLLSRSSPVNKEQPQKTEAQIQILADFFHFAVTVLFRADIFFLMQKKKQMKLIKKVSESSSEELSVLQKWFRGYLYERKAISRSEVLQLKNTGILDFKGAGKILKQLCSYNQEQQMFNYSNSKAFKNVINQFPLLPQRQNYETMYANTIYFEQELQIQQHSLSKQLIKLAFSTDIIVKVVDEEWQRTLKSEQYSNQAYKYGYLYLFILVVYDILGRGQNKQVKKRLEQIRSSEINLSTYSYLQADTALIKRLLNMGQKKVQQQQIKSEPTNKNKQLANQKKKKIAEKFKQKRQMVLKRVSSLNEGKAEEEEEVCILCHEKSKLNNKLVYLASINKNNTICGAVHGKNNVTNTFINTCFHAIHVNCFIQMDKKNDLSFNCPYCQAFTNFIIPIEFNSQDKRLNKICENAMVACMVSCYKIYDIESNFILIFKHLVQSKGLNSILQNTRYEQKRNQWTRNDGYLLGLMQSIYEKVGQQGKKELQSHMHDLITEIKNCQKQQCKQVQLLFAEALKSIVTNQTNSQTLKIILLRLRELLNNQEFTIIEEQLNNLTHQQIDLPELTNEQNSKQKPSLSFNLIRLPDRAIDCIAKFSGVNCCETNNVEYYCLMCGKNTCSNCKQDHSNSSHNKTTIYCQVNDLRVECTRKNYYTLDDVYENQFRLSYSQRNDYEEMHEIEDYSLNELKLDKVVNKFLEN